MTSITLDSIRRCFDGVIPSTIATCASDGTPNIAYASQVHYVDNDHVALTFQFFNRTRENILVNPRAMVQVIDPLTGTHYRLALSFLRTETTGPLFEIMKAKLAGIASHTGMANVFRLQGADIYRVLSIQSVGHQQSTPTPPAWNRLAALRVTTRWLADANDPAMLFDNLMKGLQQNFSVTHAMLLMHDKPGNRLFTVASCGYPSSGIGSEISIGCGIVGVTARERVPIRLVYSAGEYAYSRTVRENLRKDNINAGLESEIPFPGLELPNSQLAVPIILCDDLLGVLYVESPMSLRFTHEDEDALVVLADQLASNFRAMQMFADAANTSVLPKNTANPANGAAIMLRHFAANGSVFIEDDYLIKGVAGAIFWKLVRDYVTQGRCEFSNREMRLDTSIGLPDISDNLEARLILLQKRLAERCEFLRIEKIGRGRFRLCVDKPITLEEK